MNEQKVIDQIIRNVQAIHTDETRLDMGFVTANLDTIRATAIQLFHKTFKRVSPLCYQNITLEYDSDLQEDVGNSKCVTKFTLPNYIELDGRMDGVSFIGNSENVAFRRIKSRAELSGLLSHKQLSPYTGRYVGVLTEGGVAECYYVNPIKEVRLQIILERPSDDPYYNPLTDNYPVSINLIPYMTDELIKHYFARVVATPVDYQPNKNDTVSMPIMKR